MVSLGFELKGVAKQWTYNLEKKYKSPTDLSVFNFIGETM